MIRQKAQQEAQQYQEIVDEIYQKIINAASLGSGFSYQINPNHTVAIRYIPNRENMAIFNIVETVYHEKGEQVNDQNFLLRNFEQAQFRTKSDNVYQIYYTSAYLNNSSDEQVKKLLNILVRRPDFDQSKYGFYVM